MNKRISTTFVTIFFALIPSLGCSIPLYASQGQPVEKPAGHPTSVTTTAQEFEVVADVALRIRDLPEEWGGSELTTIPNGDYFRVYACMNVDGTAWAFGGYTDSYGKHWIGYAAARYLQNSGCPK